MKILFATITTLFSINLYAQSFSVHSVCTPITTKKINAGIDGEISNIVTLDLTNVQSAQKFQAILKVESSNGEKSLRYTLKKQMDGTLVELENAKNNDLRLDAVFLQFGEMEVGTAGPVPEGTHHQKVAMAIVDSNMYYKNDSPMTVEKIVFSCETTVQY